MKKSYIYISTKNFDGTVYKTQIIDWLTALNEKGLNFTIYQFFHFKDILNIEKTRQQISSIRQNTSLYKSSSFQFPSSGIFTFLNAILIYLKLWPYLAESNEVIVFSRGLLGKEFRILKRLSRKIRFCFDARAASAEENKYSAIKRLDFSLWKYKKIAHIQYTEYMTLITADRIFAVSQNLIHYFEYNYGINPSKFTLYPCLSDHRKFYFNEQLRTNMRRELQLQPDQTVFLYSGGLSTGNDWHITDEMFRLFDFIALSVPKSYFLILTRDINDPETIFSPYKELKQKVKIIKAENEEVCGWLNAADYGVLFRENTIMNHVASPSKFAEYILCGLPVLISEGVGDFTAFAVKFNLGYIITSEVLNNPAELDLDFFTKICDRKTIAETGRQHMSKDSIIPAIVSAFNSI